MSEDQQNDDILMDTGVKNVEVEYNGKVLKMKCYPITRPMRNEAIEAAAIAYQKRYGDKGMLPSVFERELAIRIIKSWNQSKPVKIGWDLLPMELGDKVSDAIGVKQAMESLRGNDSTEVQEAKNLSPENDPQEVTPTA